MKKISLTSRFMLLSDLSFSSVFVVLVRAVLVVTAGLIFFVGCPGPGTQLSYCAQDSLP
jgi:hypothetical protein